MSFVAWGVLALVAAVLIPGVEALAAGLMWLALAVAGMMVWTDQTADLPAALGVVALAAAIRFVRLRVAARLW